MIQRYFKKEMEQFKELGQEFAKAHPALAPMLSGPVADPDVERLIEGVSFQTALLRQKLDDEFPEIVQDLIRLLWPHYLRPIPSASTIVFQKKTTMKQAVTVAAGTMLESIPVGETACFFKTCYDVDVHPLSIRDAVFEEPSGRPPHIRLTLDLDGINLTDWQVSSLRFFLSGDYNTAADLYFLLMRHLGRIVLKPAGEGASTVLHSRNLKEAGFSAKTNIFPYPPHAFPGYRLLQEYFYCPDKFLYVDLTGWEQWKNRGEATSFEIYFELDKPPVLPSRVSGSTFVLSATPVINLFERDAEPIIIDHHRDWHYVRPDKSTSDQCQIYSIDKVTGYTPGNNDERVYQPFDQFNPDVQATPVYHTNIRQGMMSDGLDVYLAVAYPPGVKLLEAETLSLSLTCTNGTLPQRLRIGDICLPSKNCPEYLTVRNIKPLTQTIVPPLGTGFLWRLISHLSLNYLSLANKDNLRALLDLYIFPESQSQSAVLANKKRISGIDHLEDKVAERLFRGMIIRGRDITIRLRKDHYASTGDMFIFGCVLDNFFGGYASINSYTALTVSEALRGEQYSWPARLGNQPLI